MKSERLYLLRRNILLRNNSSEASNGVFFLRRRRIKKFWRGTQVEREQSAKLRCMGAIPIRASFAYGVWRRAYGERQIISPMPLAISLMLHAIKICRDGGIGIRTGLKILRP